MDQTYHISLNNEGVRVHLEEGSEVVARPTDLRESFLGEGITKTVEERLRDKWTSNQCSRTILQNLLSKKWVDLR